METYDKDGYLEGGWIWIQLKVTDKFDQRKRGDSAWVDIDAGHLEAWIDEPMPVFLIFYDAQAGRAYWIHVQDYFAADPLRSPKRGAKTLRLYIPLANEFTETTVEYMRTKKAEILAKDPRKR